jgi:hypothetical protein
VPHKQPRKKKNSTGFSGQITATTEITAEAVPITTSPANPLSITQNRRDADGNEFSRSTANFQCITPTANCPSTISIRSEEVPVSFGPAEQAC